MGPDALEQNSKANLFFFFFFLVKVQGVNVLNFAGHMVSVLNSATMALKQS